MKDLKNLIEMHETALRDAPHPLLPQGRFAKAPAHVRFGSCWSYAQWALKTDLSEKALRSVVSKICATADVQSLSDLKEVEEKRAEYDKFISDMEDALKLKMPVLASAMISHPGWTCWLAGGGIHGTPEQKAKLKTLRRQLVTQRNNG